MCVCVCVCARVHSCTLQARRERECVCVCVCVCVCARARALMHTPGQIQVVGLVGLWTFRALSCALSASSPQGTSGIQQRSVGPSRDPWV